VENRRAIISGKGQIPVGGARERDKTNTTPKEGWGRREGKGMLREFSQGA